MKQFSHDDFALLCGDLEQDLVHSQKTNRKECLKLKNLFGTPNCTT